MAINVGALPQIVAGPIVRRVNRKNVAVWVALKSSASVTLEVIQPANPNATPPIPKISLTSLPVSTVQVGTNLHLALVDFDFLSAPSNPATIYFYNLHFTGGVSGDLRSPGVLTAGTTPFSNDILSYPAAAALYPDQAGLPSFALPQSALADVRLCQGSCRKTQADSVDTMILLDNDIANSFSAPGQPNQALPPSKRLQQLFLTGDQIYGDDVGDSTLVVIRDVAAALIGDTLLAADIPASHPDIAVGKRQPFVISKCGFTPDTDPHLTMKSHLLLFGEFCGMHLVMWSPVLWPNPLALSTVQSIYGPSPSRTVIDFFNAENAGITSFVRALPAARRALANIATYMVLDDHDVTDDFYLNRTWINQVVASPVGRTVLRNGLLAYALFQGWGNDPDNSKTKFGPLLAATTNWAKAPSPFSPTDTTNLPVITGALRVPTGVSILAPFVFQTDADNDPSITTIDWHFNFKYDNYEIVVLDTRTHRTYPIPDGTSLANAGLMAPGLISADSLNVQVPGAAPVWTDPNGGVTIIVVPGPLTTLSVIEKAQRESTKAGEVFGNDVELLHFDNPTFDAFIARFAARDANGGRIVVFCGDVHSSYPTAMQYWTRTLRNPLDPASPAGATKAVVAQLISSAIKNQSSPKDLPGTLALHYAGFDKEQITANRLGWLFPPAKLPPAGQAAKPFIVGRAEAVLNRKGGPVTQTVAWPVPVDRSNSTAVTELFEEAHKYSSVTPGAAPPGGPPDIPVPPGPDWQLLRTLIPGQTPTPNVQKVDTGLKFGDKVSVFATYRGGYVDVGKKGQQVVGVNNIAFVTFTWGPTGRAVTQDVFWFKASFDKLYAAQPASGDLTAFIGQFRTKTSMKLPLELPGPMPSGAIALSL